MDTTDRMIQVGNIVGVKVVDHLIINTERGRRSGEGIGGVSLCTLKSGRVDTKNIAALFQFALLSVGVVCEKIFYKKELIFVKLCYMLNPIGATYFW